MTYIQIIKGDCNKRGRRTGLTGEQRAGGACLVCGGTQAVQSFCSHRRASAGVAGRDPEPANANTQTWLRFRDWRWA